VARRVIRHRLRRNIRRRDDRNIRGWCIDHVGFALTTGRRLGRLRMLEHAGNRCNPIAGRMRIEC
jgi:hypothetical protein